MKALALPALLLATSLLPAAEPQWIWGEQDEESGSIAFQRQFELPAKPTSAVLRITADDFFSLVVNGRFQMFSENWNNLRNVDLEPLLKEGKNTITVGGRNREGAAGLLAWIDAEMPDGESFRLVTDDAWQTRPGDRKNKGDDWRPATIVGPLGCEPWGNPWSGSGVEHITVPEGFTIERLYEVPAAQGSWISIANDGRGGFYVSDEKTQGIFRLEVPEGGEPQATRLPVELSAAHGLLVHDGALFANISGKGLHRIDDRDGDGLPDTATHLGGSKADGEHGIHGLTPDLDGEAILFINGNRSKVPGELLRNRVSTSYESDLVERIWDPKLIGRKAWIAPAGWIGRYHPEREGFEVISVGYRNAYDVAVNAFGDLFTYDSDEEWDLGMPWYRPTRINLATSGSDVGWRSGSDKWPAYFEDTVPPLVEIGPGSPTGMLSGRGAAFPAKYQHAIFALDWTYGTMRALHLTPQGSAYAAEVEEFVTGTPLPLTDAVIAPDGSLVFVTGGRRVASNVYRVRYVGGESTAPAPAPDSPAARAARELRHQLETYHGVEDPAALDAAWPHLASDDRFLRFAARLAVEAQPLADWRPRVADESRPQAIIAAVVALARMGADDDAALAQRKLDQLDLAALEVPQLLGALRAQSLVWERLGVTDRAAAIERLLPLFPAEHGHVTQELARLLAFLDDERFLEPAFAVLADPQRPTPPRWANLELFNRNQSASYGGTFTRYLNNRPPETAIRVAVFLADFSDRWSEAQARAYFEFINSLADYQGGSSYTRFIAKLRERVLADAAPAVAEVAAEFPAELVNRRPINVKPPQGPGRTWTVDEALRELEALGMNEASAANGRNAYHATGCVACHIFDGEGGAIGPGLSNLRGKFGVREVLEAIIEPSKAISDQYGSYEVALEDGRLLTGLVIETPKDEDVQLYVGEELMFIPRAQVKSIRQSPVSTMPPGLINTLNAVELRDLVAYLLDEAG